MDMNARFIFILKNNDDAEKRAIDEEEEADVGLCCRRSMIIWFLAFIPTIHPTKACSNAHNRSNAPLKNEHAARK